MSSLINEFYIKKISPTFYSLQYGPNTSKSLYLLHPSDPQKSSLISRISLDDSPVYLLPSSEPVSQMDSYLYGILGRLFDKKSLNKVFFENFV